MKTYLYTIIASVILFSGYTFGQKKGQPSFSEEQYTSLQLAQYEAKYKQALLYEDIYTAINTCYDLISLAGEGLQYKDSLLVLYYVSGIHNSAVLLGESLIKENPENFMAIEMLASTYRQIGDNKKSLEYYETLNAREQQLYYLYEIASLQFNLQRFGECAKTLEQIINHEEAADKKVLIANVDGTGQQVPYLSAAYNIVGVLNKQLGNEEVAQKAFSKAVSLFPDFQLAKQNLDLILQKVEEDDKRE